METFITLDPTEARASGIPADGVRHNTEHSLRVDERLAVGVKRRRRWHCICGNFVMFAYDTPAKAGYRSHFRDEEAMSTWEAEVTQPSEAMPEPFDFAAIEDPAYANECDGCS